MSRLKKGLALVLTLCMMLSLMPVITPSAAALTMGTKPVNGTTTGNPFAQGTGGSNSFRIPAMVTLKNGTIVAAADARWNTTYDGGGLDTIVSYSTDNGANWNYTFANYLGDNGNVYNGSGSTAFIDPALATDGKAVYMLCDLYPYGVALNGSGNTAPSTAVGFNDDGTLKLAANGSSDYSFYLKDGQIYDSSNNVVSGYTVDAYFNITGNGYDTNLFFSDSPYQVVRTGYLYLTKSTDGGQTWSAPTLIPNVKTSSEQVCLVGPGRGLVTGGKIIFPVYSYNGDSSSQQMGFIYSTNGGETWNRSANFNGDSWSSESAVVELTDGTLRFFYRNGNSKLYYADYTWGTGWGSAVNTGIATNSNTQISAISYSKDVDGKQVILVSCPTGSNSAGSVDSSANARLNGKIFVGYVNSDKTMDWQTNKTISVPSVNSSNQFMYSCLTELTDGSMAILYEDYESNWGNGYYTMSYKTYSSADLGLTSSSGETGDSDPDLKQEYITLTVGESKPFTDPTGNYKNSYTSTGLNESIAKVKVTGTDGQEEGVGYEAASVTCNDLISSDSKNWTAASGYYYTPDGNKYYPVYAKRSWKISWSGLTYTYTWGYYATGNVTQIGTQSTTDTGTTPNITVYTEAPTEAVPASTTITFTGVSAGTTSVVVGNTKYNITVKRKTETVNLTAGGTATYTDASTSAPVVADSSVASATLSGGTLTIKGLKDGTTTITTNTTVYTVTVSDGQAISIKENETRTIGVNLANGQTVEWSSADGNYVGVAGKYDTTAGAYTNEAILAGQNVTSSPVTVTATIKNADGSVVGTQKWLVTVTEGDADTNTSSKGIYFNISTIEHCTVYYSINGGELIPVNGTGVTTGNWTENGTYKGHFNIMFFAAPDEGYALTYMSISGSADQYYTLANGNPDGTGSDAWPFKDANASTIPSSSSDSAWKTVNGSLHGFRWALLEGNMTIDQMKVLFSKAIALGCDGATTITKNGNDGMGSASSPTVCKFVAQKLPTVAKTITSVTHDGTTNPYTDGMKVEVGDTITYSVVVTRYATSATYGTITYDNEKLTDALTNNKDISDPDMGTSTTSDKKYTYTTSLTLTMNNFADVVKDGKITNTAEFSYSYSSEYSAGSLTSDASAVADITVSVPEYVIDFGLPVSIDLSGVAGNTPISSGTAAYGTIAPNGTSFTYTPNTVLKGMDHVTVHFTNGQSYGVNIYPATTVYYEEGFASNLGNFKGTGTQTASEAGKKANYGYDAAYTGATYQSQDGTQLTEKATFAFTGTGVDIYTNNKADTGSLMIKVKKDGTLKKMIAVDTQLKAGTSNSTAVPNQAYNVPVASITGLEYGNYTIELTNVKSGSEGLKDVFIDGFRVYGTLQDQNNEVYRNDLEDNPTFIEMRDEVLTAQNVSTADSKYADQIAKSVYSQVFNSSTETTEGAIILSGNTRYNNVELKDLLDNGPKNEIYLQPGQALVFKVTTPRVVQIGLKALNAATTYTITGKTGDQTLNSSTDMFYTVANKGTATNLTVTITNTGSGILSITKLKICDDPNATLGTLTAEDLIPALVSLGFETTPDESGGSSGGGGGGNTPAEPTEPTEPTTPPTGIGLPFTDVGPGDWFLENVKYVYEKGLMNGTSDTTFSPKQTTNRAMIVTILHRLEHSPAVDAQSPFADVAADQYYANPVAWAAANGIVNGISKTSFAPLNNITREQMAAILYRYAQFKDYDVSVGEDTNILSYADAETISEYAVPAMQWAVGSGLINGKGGGVLDPQGSATRAEVSAILARFCEAYAK